MQDEYLFDAQAWKRKAMAFVTRSHRHLWGKNNEAPQAFLFTRGLKNSFIKAHLLGWNKFGQERPAQNWGLAPEVGGPMTADKKLFLPSGIVIPSVVEKELRAVFILSYDDDQRCRTTLVPGSSSPTLVLGAEKNEKIAIVQDMIDGLFLFQETRSRACVMIHPDPGLPLDLPCLPLIKQARSVTLFSAEKKGTAGRTNLFSDLPALSVYTYPSKEGLKERFLKD